MPHVKRRCGCRADQPSSAISSVPLSCGCGGGGGAAAQRDVWERSTCACDRDFDGGSCPPGAGAASVKRRKRSLHVSLSWAAAVALAAIIAFALPERADCGNTVRGAPRMHRQGTDHPQGAAFPQTLPLTLRLRGGAADNQRYYKLLELDPGEESEAAIKKAYKKAALKWHPDKNVGKADMAERKFKEVSEAYEILSDKDKKQMYDQYGEDAMKDHLQRGGGDQSAGQQQGFPGGVQFSFSGQGGGGFTDPRAVFEQFFGGGGGGSFFSQGGDPFGEMGGGQRRVAQPIEKKFACTLEEIYSGCTRQFRIGQRVVSIDVKPGWKAGTKVTFDEQGQKVVFILEEAPHKWFTRDGDDIRWACALSRDQATKGVALSIPTLDGSQVKLSTKGERTYNGSCKAIAGKGMWIKGGPARGALIIDFKVTG